MFIIVVIVLFIIVFFLAHRSNKKADAAFKEAYNFEPSKCMLVILGKDDSVLFSKEFIGSFVKRPWNAYYYYYEVWRTAEQKALEHIADIHRDGFIYQKDIGYINTRDIYNCKIEHIISPSEKEKRVSDRL